MARTTTKSTAPAAKTAAAKPADDEAKSSDQAAPAKTLPVADNPAETDAATITVTCLRPEGRRRAGRRWDQGATVIPETALSDFDLAVLEADPMFLIER